MAELGVGHGVHRRRPPGLDGVVWTQCYHGGRANRLAGDAPAACGNARDTREIRDRAGAAGIRPGFFTFVGYWRAACTGRFLGDCHLRAQATSTGLNGLDGRRRRCLPAAAFSALLSFVVAGCGTITAQTGSSAYIAPGKFDVYTCSDIAERGQIVQKRKDELEQLIGRASGGAGGSVVSAIAYRAEYMQSRDELVELSRASADKQCASKSPWASGRAVF
jgi:hypothetical protein